MGVTSNFKPAQEQLKKFKRDSRKKLAPLYKELITSEILGGRSPVKGKGRFKEYSDSYKTSINRGDMDEYGKTVRPVNLKVSGELLASLKVKFTKNGLSIKFDNVLADFHNRLGAGKSKVIRRMLPTNRGEQFNLSIQKRVREVLANIADKIFKR